MPSYTEAARELALLNPDQFHTKDQRHPTLSPSLGTLPVLQEALDSVS